MIFPNLSSIDLTKPVLDWSFTACLQLIFRSLTSINLSQYVLNWAFPACTLIDLSHSVLNRSFPAWPQIIFPNLFSIDLSQPVLKRSFPVSAQLIFSLAGDLCPLCWPLDQQFCITFLDPGQELLQAKCAKERENVGKGGGWVLEVVFLIRKSTCEKN